MKILIIANSRYKGGLSGGDNIYENFKKYWPCEVVVSEMQQTDYLPFVVCYCQRIIVGIGRAWMDANKYEFVYSASDFLPDALPALVYRLKGNKWIAGYFLHAFKENPLHYYSQKVVRQLIKWFADMVIVTNPTMYHIFQNKKKTWINGGIDLSLAGLSDKPKIYDAVFCGRIHPSKGIDELIEIWDLVIKEKPDAKLAIIGDGDLGIDYIKNKLKTKNYNRITGWDFNGVDLLGYMGDERFEIYKQSKVVLYPTPLKYDHFSMAPVEAMACGCPLVIRSMPSNRYFFPLEDLKDGEKIDLSNEGFAKCILRILSMDNYKQECLSALIFSQQFDYKKQAMRVWEDVNANIDNGSEGNVRDFSMPEFKRTHPDSTFKS